MSQRASRSSIVSNQVQNGVTLYTTLGCPFTLLNLTVFLQHQTSVADVCAKLSLLLLLLLAWGEPQGCHLPNPEMLHQLKAPSLFPLTLRFLLENVCLHEHVRYILFMYPVVMTWLAGVLSASDGEVFIFAGIAPHHVPVPTQIINLFSPSSASILATSSI